MESQNNSTNDASEETVVSAAVEEKNDEEVEGVQAADERTQGWPGASELTEVLINYTDSILVLTGLI